MNKKLFISQPMNGLSDDVILAKRKQISEIFKKKGYEIIDTFFEEEPGKEIATYPLYYLGKSISSMAEADVVLFCKGYENARGCRMEHAVAKEYGVTIIYE